MELDLSSFIHCYNNNGEGYDGMTKHKTRITTACE